MNSPPRLLLSCSHLEARELLRAGIAEAPTPSARRATALALGMGAGIGVTSAAGTAGATVAASSLGAPSLALVVGKWVALGTFAGLALAGGAGALLPRATHGGTPPSVQANPQPVLPVAEHVVVRAPSDAERPQAADEVPAATPVSPSVGVRPVVSPTPPAAGGLVANDLPNSASLPNGRDLGREVAEIDAARRAVTASNARVALQHLDQYAALDHSPTLDREAQLLRIDALLLAGSKTEALSLAQSYLAQHPNDPHSARLRTLGQPQ